MRALESAVLPSNWRSYAGILWHRRAGLSDPDAMPCIERTLHTATIDAGWLAAYRTCVGLSAGNHAELPLEAQFRKPVSLPSTIVISVRRDAQCDALRITNRDGSVTHVNGRITRREQV